MTQPLEVLLAEGIIEEVLGRLKSGKEAEVWLVRHREETLAAKVYKEREFRSFKNNAGYMEGRAVRNTRTQRAMNNGSRFGQAAAEEAWKSAEVNALSQLHAAGVRVPKPVLFYEGVLLMEVIVDAEGRVAPRLVDANIDSTSAPAMYAMLREQAVRLLCADLIHGDLSEFNVLLAHDGPVIIDLPQVISAAQNSRAEQFFKRDIENLRRFFGGFAPEVHARASDADEIWRAYVRRDLTPDFVPTGRAAVARTQQQPGQQRRPQQQQHGQRQPGAQDQRAQGRPNGPRQPSPNAPPKRPAQRGPEVSYRGKPPPGPAGDQQLPGARGPGGGAVSDGSGGRRPGGGGGQANAGGGRPNGGQANARGGRPNGGGGQANAGGGRPNGSRGGQANAGGGRPNGSRPDGGGGQANAGGSRANGDGGGRRRRRRYF